ncbi:MFS transporter [Atopobacter sp. AH10]|uniref:MFS transporter n=1 Tax=Atopobacter sp. AH10 TaxID=2315861 RepID=UPI000EF22A13|nr:MFS transporter [Atopobacter sp. AH10]RLK62985.1 MFS transporter [Atopobacter sp. AH10]
MSLTKNQIRTVVAAIIASGTDDLNVMFLAFSMSSIIAEFSLKNAQAGMIATITNLGMLLGGVWFGVLADRHNKMTVFKWTLAIFSLATVGIFFAPNIYVLYLLRFIAGIGVGGEYGIALSIMAHIVPANRMGRISSLNGVAGQVGSIASATIAGLFLSRLGWRALFLFGLFPLLIVFYLQFFIKEEKSFQPDVVKEGSNDRPSIKDLFKTKEMTHQTLMLMVMTTVQIAGYFGMMNWLPTMMQKQAGISLGNSSWWMIATIMGMSCGMICFGRFLDAFGPRAVFGTFLITSALAVYLFSLIRSEMALLFGGALMGFFVNGMFAGYGAVVSRLYEARIQSIANNIILNVGRAIGGFSSLIIGMIMDHSGTTSVMLFLSALYLISFTAMMTIPGFKRESYIDGMETVAACE